MSENVIFIGFPSKSMLPWKPFIILYTVNVEIFAQYITSRISRRAIDTRKFDVSENYNQNRTNRIKWYVREN